MSRHPARATLPSAQLVAEKVFNAFERFLHVEAVGGIVLLVSAAAALLWANSPFSESYHHLWETPLTVGVGSFATSRSLHFVINDALMTVFFLVVGMEIRREIHEGALAQLRVAVLPLAAALGGVAVPAAFYLLVNSEPLLRARVGGSDRDRHCICRRGAGAVGQVDFRFHSHLPSGARDHRRHRSSGHHRSVLFRRARLLRVADCWCWGFADSGTAINRCRQCLRLCNSRRHSMVGPAQDRSSSHARWRRSRTDDARCLAANARTSRRCRGTCGGSDRPTCGHCRRAMRMNCSAL